MSVVSYGKRGTVLGMGNSQIGSNKVRDNFADVLTAVEHGGVHFTVMRYRKPAAVIVPVGWYEQIKGLLENRAGDKGGPP